MAGANRKDIDGLRAVAVLCVLFFHAGIWPFRGGYIGVDVFFVISGYLITGLVLREQSAGTFSLLGFYDRRIRRILPALFVVLAASSIAAFFILLPDELKSFAILLRASTFFYSNIVLWRQSFNYFGPLASENPLLHIWSLAIEEQFYLIWPIALILLAKRRSLLPYAIAILCALSFVAAVVITERQDPAFSFYSLQTRAWEILAGAFLAAVALPPLRTVRASSVAGVLGLGLILFAAIGFNDQARFPAWNSVGAVLGTLALIQAGAAGGNPIGAAIGSPVPAFIGRISYSLYLWHWPLLVFPRLVLNRELYLSESVLALAAAALLATASYVFVEQPARRGNFSVAWIPARFTVALLASALLFGAGHAMYRGHGLPWRMPAEEKALQNDAGPNGEPHPCLYPARNMPLPKDGRCILGAPKSAGQVVVWGDSFADALVPGLLDFAAGRGLSIRSLVLRSCPPLPGQSTVLANGIADLACRVRNDAALRIALGPGPTRIVVLHANWSIYIDEPARLVGPDAEPLGGDGARGVFVQSLDGLVRSLAAHGLQVVIVGSLPAFDVPPLHCLGRNLFLGRTGNCDAPATQSEASRFADAAIRRIAAHYPNVRAYFPRTVLCNDVRCPALSGGHLLFRDRFHLSKPGAALVGRALQDALRDWSPQRGERQPRHS